MTVIAPDEADLAVLGEFERRLDEGPKDPRMEWRAIARPDQLLPDGDWRVLYFQGGRGSGKLLDMSTLIPIPGGWSKLSEINVGDEVFDEQGRVCRVTATFDDVPKVAYRLWFSDGTSIDACADHQWVTWTYAERKAFLRSPYEDITRLPENWPQWRLKRLAGGGSAYLTAEQVAPALEMRRNGASISRCCAVTGLSRNALTPHLLAGRYIEQVRDQPKPEADSPGPQIRTTQQIADTIAIGKRGDTNHSVPVCGALQLPDANLPVDPYVLGCWLGDGSSAAAVITSADPEILDHIRACGETVERTKAYPGRCCGYAIGARGYVRDPATGRMQSNGSLHSRLRALGLLGSKHVPAIYLRASAGQRLALLQGLMDTDGSANAGRCTVEFCSTNRALADAVTELARSLGQKAVCKESRAKLYGQDCGPRWRITWRPTIPVFRLSRKLELWHQPDGQAFRHQHRMIVRAEPIPPAAMRCLTVDSPNHMYLAGESMIPTHNTRSGAQGLGDIILSDPEPEGQYGVIGPTYRDAWTVQVEGESGLLRALGTTPGEVKHGKSRLVEYAHRSYGEIGLRNGHVIFVDSADDGAIRVQGKNLRAAWCGEIGLWTRWATAWDESVKYAVRKGSAKIICDGTPKVSRPARALIRRFLRGEEPGVIVRRLRTIDNADNLSEAFYQAVIGAAKGTRLERQELEGELLDDIENALWTRALLEGIQVPAVGADGGIGYLHGAIIGVDPSDGNEDSDEQAYTVAGKGAPDDHHLYVVENWGGQMAPAAFARLVILKAVQWHARIVVEKNHGGAWLTTTFHQVMKDLDKAGKIPDHRLPRVETIHASQAKRTRAEPVSAMYERDLVRHCYQVEKYQAADRETGDMMWRADRKGMVELEDQMATFTGAAGERSPDRLDSLVWSLTPFLDASFGPPGTSGRRQWAGSQDLGNIGVPEEARAHRRMREIHEKAVQGIDAAPWDLDGFAPADDREELARPRNNVRAWR